ncbi:nitrate reductase [Aurantimonas aggregata]|uniref:Nitrate reductase n=1 Tax=Aurantimonas aggregata TaxID=2047720 RepID=A0A6L9MMY4_9HYPH|nr:nitrate reductase [Aurantimonas aggregata]NDV89269.1 nitrate reductase [Aurantimonas aggregata]
MSGFVNPLARKQKPGYPEAVAALKAETRRLLDLSDDVTVSVTELTCRDLGCPDIETVIGILVAGTAPRIAKIHKTVPEVTPADLAAAFAAGKR